MKLASVAILAALLAVPSAAQAGELFGGLYVHDIDTPLTKSGYESGVDIQLGWRGDRIGRTPLQPHIFGAVNTAGETNYAVVGLSAKFGREIYVRPGLGLAIHSGSAGNFHRTDRIAFGSRILFAPELGVGFQASEKVSVEASWVHMSHAQLEGRENPGIDNLGFRVNLAL